MIQYQALAGTHLRTAILAMKEIAEAKQEEVSCKFNDVTFSVKPGDDPEAVFRALHDEQQARHHAWEGSDEGKAALKAQEEAQAKAAEAAARGVLPFAVIDPAHWAKRVDLNTDDYSACVIRYAARWANFMEREILTGAKLEQIADKTSHEADQEGITGFMYGAAVSELAKAWVHGEALRKWHNLKTQLRDEGEVANQTGTVLNPALLTLK